jgi:beta-galactosidase
VVRTAGEPSQLRLTPDRRTLRADGEDLSFLLVEALDQDGNLCPLAMNRVDFKLDGPGTIAGVANGDHHFPAEFDADHVTLFYGKATLVVRAAEGRKGSTRVTASTPGLRPAQTLLRSR